MNALEMARNRAAAGIGDATDRAVIAAAERADWFGDAIDLSTAFSTNPPQRDDVLFGIEPGNVVALGAPGGGSKTFFTMTLLFDLALGGSVSAVATTLVPNKQQSSLMLTAEESLEELQRRAYRFGSRLDAGQRTAAAGLIQIRSMKKRVPVLIERDGSVNEITREHLERASDGHRFVVLDPLGRYVRGDKNDEAVMVTFVTTLEEIAQRIGCVFFVPHHTGKNAILQGNGDSALAMKGSTALIDSCRMAMMIFRPTRKIAEQRGIEANRYRIVKVDKANHVADKGTVWFRVRDDGTLAYDEYETNRDDAAEFLKTISSTKSKSVTVLSQRGRAYFDGGDDEAAC